MRKSSLDASMLKTQDKPIFQFESKGRTNMMSQFKDRQTGEVPSYSVFLFYSGLQLIRGGPNSLWRAIWFTQSTSSNVGPLKKTATLLNYKPPKMFFLWSYDKSLKI